MKRKITAAVLASVMCTAACGCSDKNDKKPDENKTAIVEVIPTALLTVNDVSAKTGTPLVQEGDIEVKDGAKTVLYRSEPLGAADTVKVSVVQYSGTVSKESIQQQFESDRAKRTDAVDSQTIENCFTAFPTAYYCKDGYYIKITAGSGNTEEQRKLLESLMQTAASNLNEFTAK